MGYSEYPPHPALPGVKCLWSIDDPPSPEIQEIWPDGCLELVFTPGNTFLLNPSAPETPFPPVFLLGLQTRIVRVRTDGPVRILGARLFPSGIGGWTAAALDSLAARILPIVSAARFPEAAALLESWLLRHPPAPSSLAAALSALSASAGSLTVADLARSHGLSSRHLQRRFALELGLPPKSVAKILRFAESWSRLLRNPHLSLAELALELGYSDQAHFNNEFSSFAQQSPGRFRRSLLRSPRPPSAAP